MPLGLELKTIPNIKVTYKYNYNQNFIELYCNEIVLNFILLHFLTQGNKIILENLIFECFQSIS